MNRAPRLPRYDMTGACMWCVAGAAAGAAAARGVSRDNLRSSRGSDRVQILRKKAITDRIILPLIVCVLANVDTAARAVATMQVIYVRVHAVYAAPSGLAERHPASSSPRRIDSGRVLGLGQHPSAEAKLHHGL